MTQLEAARKGKVTEEMMICAQQEGVTPEFMRRGIEEGAAADRARGRRGDGGARGSGH